MTPNQTITLQLDDTAPQPSRKRGLVSLTRRGGLWFFRCGRFGGSLYLAKAASVPCHDGWRAEWRQARDEMVIPYVITVAGVVTLLLSSI